MSTALRILDETRLEGEEVCEITGWSMVTFYRNCRHRGLEHLRTGPRRGSKIITSREALERFLARLNGIDLDAIHADEAIPARSTKRREAELAAVDRELAAAGY